MPIVKARDAMKRGFRIWAVGIIVALLSYEYLLLKCLATTCPTVSRLFLAGFPAAMIMLGLRAIWKAELKRYNDQPTQDSP